MSTEFTNDEPMIANEGTSEGAKKGWESRESGDSQSNKRSLHKTLQQMAAEEKAHDESASQTHEPYPHVQSQLPGNSWLWPDHNIGMQESRKLRDEHNALYNAHAKLLEEHEALKKQVEQKENPAPGTGWRRLGTG